MISYITRFLAVLATLLFTGFSLYILILYTKPVNDQFYNLSMFGTDGEMMEWDGDTKGWAVFTQEKETRHGLEPLGWGSYTGLDYPSQTVYCSRMMTEEVNSPTLRLYTANRAVAVFLESEVIYTDCPEQDNRIGYLTLPTLGWNRETLIITLPSDYLGKTLTIAQSNPEIADFPSQITLCGVEFYCSYTVGSTLISESFSIAIPATLAFALGVLSLAALLWQGFHNRWDMGLAALAVTAFSLTLGLLNQASFFYIYFDESIMDLNALCRAASLSALLVFLGQRGGRLRWLLWILAFLHGGLTLLGRGYVFSQFATLSELAGCAGLLACAILALRWQREGRYFYRLFTPLYLILLFLTVTGAVIYGFFSPEWGQKILIQLQTSIHNGTYRFFIWKWSALALIGGAVSVAAEIIHQENERRIEVRLLLQQGVWAQENYENLRNQNEAILSLRHDLRHHISVLRSLCQEGNLERMDAYLDTMGAENTIHRDYTVHPVVNGVLTVMLTRGARLGIQSDVRVQLPEQLPIPDSDLCALLMNLLENALEANKKIPEGTEKWIKVLIHIRGDYLYIGIENARFEPVNFDQEEGLFRSTKEGDIHGYGLKSARIITQKYCSELRLEALNGQFSASTALLLPQ